LTFNGLNNIIPQRIELFNRKPASQCYSDQITGKENVEYVVRPEIISDLEMDGVKSEPDADSDRESASPQYEPQFVKVKEEHMADDGDDDDDDDDNEEETMRSDEDLSDAPDEEIAEAVMFPIVKTEYHADTSQKDAADEDMFGAVKNESKVRFIFHILCLLQHFSHNKVHKLKVWLNFVYI
jgi:hypothetical protein